MRRLPTLYADAPHPVRAAWLRSWAKLNGLKLTDSTFCLDTLAANRVHMYDRGPYGCERRCIPGRHPMFDHWFAFRRSRRAAAIVTQPYDHVTLADVQQHIAAKGLVAYAPPEPNASFHYPGECGFYVIQRADAPPPKWISEQVRFRGKNSARKIR